MSQWQALDRLLDEAPGEWSVCAQGVDGQTVYGYQADTVRPAASLIKVPLAMALVISDVRRRNGGEGIDLGAMATLREEDRVSGPGALEGSFDTAPAGTTRTLWELIGHALRESDNTASNLLIRAIGMERVQEFIHDALGFSATRLQRRFMDFHAAAAGRDNWTTAREMCRVFHALREPSSPYAPLVEWLTQTDDCDKLQAGVPNGIVCAHKGGALPRIEHDAGIVFARPNPYIIALLGVDLPDEEAGKTTIACASRLVYSALNG